MSLSKNQCTAAIQKSIETGERYPLHHFDTRKYIQHNLLLEDGVAALLKFLDALPRGRTKVDVACAFEDGEFSCALADYELGDWGRMVGFEVHRWEDGKIVEHWDNLQPYPQLNVSGRSVTDGNFSSTVPMNSAAAKTLVAEFVGEVLIGRQIGQAAHYFNGAHLIQHSPRHGDGANDFVQALTGGAYAYHTLHKVIGDGELVLAISEGTAAGFPSAFYNMFRIEYERLVEHWEVIEAILPREQWQNTNGKF